MIFVFPFILFNLINLICNSISIIVCLNKKIILIKKFSKYNQVNIIYFKIKYLDLYLCFDFQSFIFKY
jgi:hypothetical protein